MKLKTILILNSIIFLINATGAILFPSIILKFYGVTQGDNVVLMAQYAGIGSVAIGLLSYYTSKIKQAEDKKYILLSIFVSVLLGFVISIMGTLRGIMNISGWSLVIIYLLFTIGYGYYLFIKKGDIQPPFP